MFQDPPPSRALVVGLALCLLAAAVPPSSAEAQASISLRSDRGVVAGDSVRVHPRGGLRDAVHARVAGWRADTLVMHVQGMAGTWNVPAGDIRTLQRYQQLTSRDGFRRGATMGLAVGLFAGAAVGLGLYALGPTHDEDGPPGEQLMASVLRFTGLGLVSGVVVGGVLGARTPGWGWIGIRVSHR